MTTATAQAKIEELKGQIATLDEKIGEARTDVEAKRKVAARALLEYRDPSKIEKEIAAIEQHITTLESARTLASEELSAATVDLGTAKRIEGEQRLKSIRVEVDELAREIDGQLTKVLSTATRFNGLLSQAWNLHQTEKLSLGPLGSWVHLTGPYAPVNIETKIKTAIQLLIQYRPKENS